MADSRPLIAVVHSWSVEQPVDKADAEPFTVTDMEDAKAALKWCDGIILTGGGDVNPAKYANYEHPQVYGVDHDRDTLEFFIARKAREKNIPIMGICRGHQLLNVAYGGTLHQHIKDSYTEKSHWGGLHGVRIRMKSLVGQAIGRRIIYGTSLHHQAIDRIGSGLLPVGWTDDGHIEMIESIPSVSHYVLGTQFHPEMDYKTDYSARLIFEHFVSMCRPKAERRRLSTWKRMEKAQAEAGQTISYYKGINDSWGGGWGDDDWWGWDQREHTTSRLEDIINADGASSSEDEAISVTPSQLKRVANSIWDPRYKMWIPEDDFETLIEEEVAEEEQKMWIRERDAHCDFPPCAHPTSCNIKEGECWARTIAEDDANRRIPQSQVVSIEKYKRGNGRQHDGEI